MLVLKLSGLQRLLRIPKNWCEMFVLNLKAFGIQINFSCTHSNTKIKIGRKFNPFKY